MEPLLLELGRDHTEWGMYSLRPGSRSAVALCVGSDPDSPSLASKGDPELLNEDAVVVRESGERTLLAVADAHHGIQASEMLIEAIAREPVPGDFVELCDMINDLRFDRDAGNSASALLVAVVDREAERGFGLSWGDCSLVAVDREAARVLNVRIPGYLRPAVDWRIAAEEAQAVQFFLQPGGLILAHTDGVNECHYRSPGTSIATTHLLDIFEETGPDPGAYAEQLMELALRGVDGHPGGQDNVGLVATMTDPGARS